MKPTRLLNGKKVLLPAAADEMTKFLASIERERERKYKCRN